MGERDDEREELYAAIDREAADPRESSESKALYEALAAKRASLGGDSQVPAEDRQLSETILAEARRRSAQISAGPRRVTQALPAADRPIPVWMIVAWLAAIALVALAVWKW